MRAALRIGLFAVLIQGAAPVGATDPVGIQAFVAAQCIVADEPFYFPQAEPTGADARAKFLPLIGLVAGKLAELFINHEIGASANRVKATGARKDTRYAMTRTMNLYRADLDGAPVPVINAELGCMTIVAAKLLPAATSCKAAYVPKTLAPGGEDLPQERWQTSRTDDSVENQLRRADICVDGMAAAVYEARFEFSKDGTAYRLHDAGYRIESLLTTNDPKARRTALYTLKVSEPSVTDQQDVLSTAWVKLGTVSAGSRSTGWHPAAGGADDAAPWLRVPPMSPEARRVFEQKTAAQREVVAQIDSLKRDITRNQRLLDGLDQRISAASGEVADGLKQERTKTSVQIQLQGAELDARNAELRELPHAPLEFMPVSIEVAVTETESEKKADLALADLIGVSGGMVASAVGTAATNILSKSVDESDLKQAGAPADPATHTAGDADIMTDTEIERALNPAHTRGLHLRGLRRSGAAAEDAAGDAAVNLNVPFEYDSSDLKPEASLQLTQLKSALTSEGLIHERFLVAGHTDSKGNARYNQQLSVRRAESVKRFLVSNGVGAERLDVVGYGGDRPIAPDRPDDPHNRRVEIRLIGGDASEH